MDWLTETKIPVGKTAKKFVDWLTDNMGWFFDGLAAIMQTMIDGLLAVLNAPHPLIVIAIFCGLAYLLRRSITVVVLTGAGLLFIVNQGYWEETMETMTLVLSACIVCMAVGVPIGIAAAHRPRLFTVLRPILDLMQTLPTFVYLIPAIVFFGIGMVPGLIATAIFVVPAPIRLTHLGISSTPRQLIEAGEAFGASRRQLLWKIEVALRDAADHGRAYTDNHVVAFDGRDRGPGRCRRARRSGCPGAQLGQYGAWFRGRPGHCRRGDHP